MDKKKNFFSDMKEKWNGFMEKTRPGREKTGRVLSIAGLWIYRLRSLILGIPVGVAAVILALRNARSLPAQIALSIPKVEDGALVIVSQMLDKNVAVMGPLAITALCILMMLSTHCAVLYELCVCLTKFSKVRKRLQPDLF